MNLYSYEGYYSHGAWVTPETKQYAKVINPATEKVIGRVPVGGASDCDRAIDAARRAFDDGPWPRMSFAERADALARLHDAVAAHQADLAQLAVAEIGEPSSRAGFIHVQLGLAYLQGTIEATRRRTDTAPLQPLVMPQPDGTKMLGGASILREPLGVAAAILPFNAPLLVALMKLGSALAAGNTMVIKPSAYTPLLAIALGHFADKAGLPPGVVNIVTAGDDVGAKLAGDPRVDVVAFTGSDETGQKVLEQAAPTMKKVLLWLAGKSAVIVRDDADLAAAVQSGVLNTILWTGQACVATTRHLVSNKVKKQYVAELAKALESLPVGDPARADTQMGPLISARQAERVKGYIESGVADGAVLVTGGDRPRDCPKGFFLRPTLLDGVSNEWKVAQDEIFGPVACVIGFDTDDEAIRIANDSRYGLSGAVFSRNVGLAYEIAREIKTGMVHINGGTGGVHPWAPFTGIRRSGSGVAAGDLGIDEFTRVKTVDWHAG